MTDKIISAIDDSRKLKANILQDRALISKLENVTQIIIAAFKSNKKVLFCGNGGSAADAQHLAAEFSGRFYFDRPPLYAEALHVNTSYLTAVANDYSYQEIYSRLIKGMGNDGDVLIGISTSGNSQNIVRAFEEAKIKGMTTIAFTGESGGVMKSKVDYLLNIPSKSTPRIQECHILLGHIICEIVEQELFGNV